MDAQMEKEAREAIERLDHVIERHSDVDHAAIQAAAKAVIAFRNHAIQKRREGKVAEACLDGANALVSLVYGAEFPLSGLHRHRFEQAREGMRKLIDGT